MMRSLYSGVSGLKNHQTRMDVVGNNISNVNTTGFKSSRVTFSDTLNQTLSGASAPTDNLGGTNPKQIGLGSATSSIDTLFTDGSVQSTGVNTDLCLSGNGLFVVKNGDSVYYTRNGNFKFDASGYYVNSDGLKVQGWMADDSGNLNTTGATGYIQIPSGKTMAATATTTQSYTSNLNSATTGSTISSVLVKYADGTSKTVTSYVPNPPTITLNTTTNRSLTLDANAAYDFTTKDTLLGKDLFSQQVDHVEGPAKVTLSSSNAAGNKIAGLGTIDYTAGNHRIDGKVTLTGTVKNRGVTTSGPDIGATVLKLTLTAPAEKNGTEVTITIPPGSVWTYKDGDTASFDFDVEQIEPATGSTIHRSDGTSYEFESSTLDPAITKDNYTNYIYMGHTADGQVLSVSHKGDDVESVTVNTTDGQSLSGLTGVQYAANDTFYPSSTTTATIYDSLGNAHSVPVLFTKTGENTWELALAGGGDSITFNEADGTTTTVTLAKTDLNFDQNGAYVSGSGSLACTYSNGASKQNVALNLAGLTQYAGSTTAFASNDGNAAGTLKSVSIDSNGVITGTYTNGINRQEAQVAIAQFNNASGLTKNGNSLYVESNNSGTPNIGTINALGCSVTPSALEMSNVDMASELTDMIVTQRGYQSNSKIITVSDELLETLINMKR